MISDRSGSKASIAAKLATSSALIFSLAVSGCTTSHGESTEQTPHIQAAVPATVAWKSKEVLVSDVYVEGNVAIAYRRQGPQLEIIARDLKTGKQIWKDEALGASDMRGVPPEVQILDHEDNLYIAYLGARTGGYGELNLANVATGKKFKVKNTFDYWGERPYVCGETFCTSGAMARDNQFQGKIHLKLDWGRKQWRSLPDDDVALGLKKDGERLGQGVISYWDDDQEMLSYTRGSKTLWNRHYENVFANGYSSWEGAVWEATGESGNVLLGYGAHAQDEFFEDDKKKVTYSLADLSKVVALDATSGRELWHQKGVAWSCGAMEGQGMSVKNGILATCYYDSGKQTLTSTRQDRYKSKSEDAAWKVVGIAVRSGKVKWRKRLQDPYEFSKRKEGAGRPFSSDSSWILPTASGDKIVNVAGEEAPLQDEIGENVLCNVDRDSYYIYSSTLGTEAPWEHKASGETYFVDAQSVCKRGTWKPTEAIPNVDEFKRAGFRDEQLVVLSGLEGMTAYRMTP